MSCEKEKLTVHKEEGTLDYEQPSCIIENVLNKEISSLWDLLISSDQLIFDARKKLGGTRFGIAQSLHFSSVKEEEIRIVKKDKNEVIYSHPPTKGKAVPNFSELASSSKTDFIKKIPRYIPPSKRCKTFELSSYNFRGDDPRKEILRIKIDSLVVPLCVGMGSLLVNDTDIVHVKKGITHRWSIFIYPAIGSDDMLGKFIQKVGIYVDGSCEEKFIDIHSAGSSGISFSRYENFASAVRIILYFDYGEFNRPIERLYSLDFITNKITANQEILHISVINLENRKKLNDSGFCNPCSCADNSMLIDDRVVEEENDAVVCSNYESNSTNFEVVSSSKTSVLPIEESSQIKKEKLFKLSIEHIHHQKEMLPRQKFISILKKSHNVSSKHKTSGLAILKSFKGAKSNTDRLLKLSEKDEFNEAVISYKNRTLIVETCGQTNTIELPSSMDDLKFLSVIVADKLRAKVKLHHSDVEYQLLRIMSELRSVYKAEFVNEGFHQPVSSALSLTMEKEFILLRFAGIIQKLLRDNIGLTNVWTVIQIKEYLIDHGFLPNYYECRKINFLKPLIELPKETCSIPTIDMNSIFSCESVEPNQKIVREDDCDEIEIDVVSFSETKINNDLRSIDNSSKEFLGKYNFCLPSPSSNHDCCHFKPHLIDWLLHTNRLIGVKIIYDDNFVPQLLESIFNSFTEYLLRKCLSVINSLGKSRPTKLDKKDVLLAILRTKKLHFLTELDFGKAYHPDYYSLKC